MSRTAQGREAYAGFPRSARLRRSRDYRRVFAKPARYSDGCFSVIVRPNGGRPARLGLAVSRKSAPRAVDRNRLKRVVRESFRRVGRPGLAGLDIIVTCRRGAAERTNAQLYRSMARHWETIQDQLCATC